MPSRAERILAAWSNKRYVDISSYTLGSHGVVAQVAMHTAFRRCMMARLRRKTGQRRFGKIVDLGCGTGEWTIDYLDMGARVVGIDVNEDFLREASRRARASERSSRLELRKMNMLHFRDYQSCDLLCFGASLQYIDDDSVNGLFARAIPAMQEDGVVYLRTTVASPLCRESESPVGFYRSAGFYRGLFRRHGLSVLDSGYASVITTCELLCDLRGYARDGRAARAVERALARAVSCIHIAGRRSLVMNWILTKVPWTGVRAEPGSVRLPARRAT